MARCFSAAVALLFAQPGEAAFSRAKHHARAGPSRWHEGVQGFMAFAAFVQIHFHSVE